MEETYARDITIQNATLKIQQDSSKGIPGIVWDCALVYLGWLNKNFDTIKTKYKFESSKVLELGSGTGISGLAFSLLKPKLLVFTDSKENLPQIRKNIEINKSVLESNNVDLNSLKVEELLWGEKSGDAKKVLEKYGPFDIIMGSDLIYDDKAKHELLYTMEEIAKANPDIVVILGYTLHKPIDKKFFEYALVNWSIEYISEAELDEEFRASDIGIAIMRYWG